METEKTVVIFRKFKGEVNALFPYISYKQNHKCTGYAHVGQHFECDFDYMVSKSKLALPSEYESLLKELEQIGYNNLLVQKKANRKLMYKL